MNRALACSLILFAASTSAVAAMAAATEDPESQLRQRESELNQAFMSGDRGTLTALLSPDWRLITSTGKVHSRDDVLNEVSDSELDFETNQAEQVEVRVYGDSAVLTGVLHQRFRYHGETKDYRVWYTDTWILRDRDWVQVSGHASPYPRPAATAP